MPLRADFRLDGSRLLDPVSTKKLIESSRSTSESSASSTNDSHGKISSKRFPFTIPISRLRDWLLERLCSALGCHPLWSLLLVILLLCPLHSFYLFHPLEIESDVRRGFAQKHGRSTAEFKTFASYYQLPFEGLEIWVVLATPKRSHQQTTIQVDGELLDEMNRLDQYVKNFTISIGDAHTTTFNETWSGEDLNALLGHLQQIHPLVDLLPGIDFKYPIGMAFGHKLHLSTHFFMVNEGLNLGNGNISLQTAKYVALWYLSKAENYEQRKKLEAVELGLFEDFLNDNFSNRFSVEMFGDQVANAEMLRGTLTSLKLFFLGGVLMVVFMLSIFRHLTSKSRILMTLAAVMSPMLATLSTFSLLGWMGVRVNSMMCITPFLVLGIGVDDAFLLLHQWRKVQRESRCLRNDQILQIVLLHVGPSMAVTSITNTLAFGIGITNPSPQMSAFCLATTLAVFLDFVYEFAIFTPIMVLFYEEKTRDWISEKEKKWFFRPSWRALVEVLFSPIGRFLVLSLCLLMYTIAGIGLSRMAPTFEPAKTFPADSELIHALRSFELIQTEYWPVNYITKKVPKTWTEVDEWDEMIHKLETRDHCYGRERNTNFLLDFYEELRKRADKSATIPSTNQSISFDFLPEFLRDRRVAERKIIQWHRDENGTIRVDGANFVIVCRVFPLPSGTDWNRRAEIIKTTRSIVDEYVRFETTIFDYDATIYDIIISVKTELIQAVVVTFTCMSLISTLFIPDLFGASLASTSMLSISACMLGFLSLWGCELDPIVMINVLMAIGFSVDFSAHICYHYHQARQSEIRESKKERLTRIMKVVGRPMIEAGISTILCMLPLFFINIYAIISFAKTVCLVSSLGLLHGLIIIPFILSFFPMNK